LSSTTPRRNTSPCEPKFSLPRGKNQGKILYYVASAIRSAFSQIWVAELIEKLERKPEQHSADLTHIDRVLRLFRPEHDPASIKPKRTYARRTRYFARNELARLIMDALRAADGAPMMTTEAIAGWIIEVKAFDAGDAALRRAIGEQVLALLRSFRKQGTVEEVGSGRSIRWRTAAFG
jgi:hypothetical protein